MSLVKFNFPEQGSGRLIFAIPQSNEYHTISHVKLNPSAELITENTWKNRVAIYTLNDVKDSPFLSFRAQFKPIAKHIGPLWHVKDYSELDSKTLTQYTKADRFVVSGNRELIKITNKVWEGEESLEKNIQSLYAYTLDYLSYGNPISGLYSAQEAYEQKVTDCGGFSTFFISLLHIMQIPSRLVVGFLLKPPSYKKVLANLNVFPYDLSDFTMHVWTEVILPDGSLFPIDPAVEWRRVHGLSHRKGGFGIVAADRLVTSYGEDMVLAHDSQETVIDILQHPTRI